MRALILAVALSVSIAPAAFAGGIHARIEGPDRDGVTYTARTYSCDKGDALEPWALAEGVVDGRRQSALIRLKPTGEHGVYRFERNWPKDGRWMIRLSLGHPPAPATVALLSREGAVQSNTLYYKSDGSRECQRTLRRMLNIAPGEDC